MNRARPALAVLAVAACLALLTGLTEAGILYFERFVLGLIPWASSEIGWRAPLTYLVLFLGAALPFAALAAVTPLQRALAALVFLLGTAGILGLSFLLLGYTLHPLAQLLLAAGAASRLAVLAWRDAEAWGRRATRALPLLLAIPALFGVGRIAWLAARERAHDAETGAPTPDHPSVLLIVLDATRGASVGVNGYPRGTTPALDRLATRGAAFTRAYATSSWTLPTHATLFTGRWPHELEFSWNRPLSDDAPVLAERFAARGYRTGGFAANTLYTTRAAGLARGFYHYEAYPRSVKQIALASSLVQLLYQRYRGFRSMRRLADRRFSPAVTEHALPWITRRDAPYFAFLNLFDAHQPYQVPQPWLRRFRSDGPRQRDQYDASVAYQDSVMGALLDSLDARGVLARTLVVVTADHGELLDEHGLGEHGSSLYELELHVPLVIAGPGVPAGVRDSTPVSLRDLAATISALAGDTAAPFPGVSLVPLLHGEAVTPSPLLAELQPPPRVGLGTPLARGAMGSLIAWPYHLVVGGEQHVDLFDLSTDRFEERDLADDPQHAATLTRLRHTLDSLLTGGRP